MSTTPPHIQTANLNIVPFTEKHICDAYIAWLNDDQLMQHSEQRHRHHTRETCEAYLHTFAKSDNVFIALEDKSGKLIGTMTVYYDNNNRIADMGILLGDKSSQGKGLALEAWQAVSDWVIQHMEPRKLTAGCMQSNTAMLRIMQKSGMQTDCIRKRHFLRNGQEEDIVYMAKFPFDPPTD